MFAPIATADTLNYMIAGYVVIFGGIAGYIASLVIRYRNAKRELTITQEIRMYRE